MRGFPNTTARVKDFFIRLLKTPGSHLPDATSVPMETNQTYYQQMPPSVQAPLMNQQQQQHIETNQEEVLNANRGAMSTSDATLFQQSFSPFSRPPSSSSLDVAPPPPSQPPQTGDLGFVESRTSMGGTGGPPSVAASQPSPALSPAGGMSRQPNVSLVNFLIAVHFL